MFSSVGRQRPSCWGRAVSPDSRRQRPLLTGASGYLEDLLKSGPDECFGCCIHRVWLYVCKPTPCSARAKRLILDAQWFLVWDSWVAVVFELWPVGEISLVFRCEEVSVDLPRWDLPFCFFLRVLGPPARCVGKVIWGPGVFPGSFPFLGLLVAEGCVILRLPRGGRGSGSLRSRILRELGRCPLACFLGGFPWLCELGPCLGGRLRALR